jgi:Icc-related predicted phosphoesterase
MRLLAAADIHGARDIYDWLQEQAREQRAELVVLAGDLSASSWDEREQRDEARTLISLFKGFPATTLYLMGNDDFFALDYEDERVKPLHGRRLDFGGYRFIGYHYTTPFIGSMHEKPEEEIEKDLKTLESFLDERTVFVTHGPAFGVLDRGFTGEHVGSHSVAALLMRRPVLAHIHGHIHQCFGRKGNHFNVAAAARRRAVLIDLPRLTHRVLTDECSGTSTPESG